MTKSLQNLILCSQFFMMLALEMGNPYLPLLIAGQGDIPSSSVAWYSALAFVLPMIANIVMTPLWGKLADSLGYKAMLMRATWALVLTQFLMLLIHGTMEILLVRVIQGGFAGFLAAMQTYCLALDSWDNKGRQLARLQTAKAMASSLAGLAGGLLLMLAQFQLLYAVAAGISLLTALIMQRCLPAVQTVQSGTGKYKGSLDRMVYLLGSLIALTQLIKFFTEPVYSLAMSQIAPGQPLLVGVLYSSPALGLLLASGWCGRQFDRCRQEPLRIRYYLAGYSVLGLLLMLIQASSTQLPLLFVTRLVWGMVLAALLPAFICLISDRCARQGYAIAVANSFAKTGNVSGLVLGGWMGVWMPMHQMFLLLAGAYTLMMLMGWCCDFIQTRALPKSSAMSV